MATVLNSKSVDFSIKVHAHLHMYMHENGSFVDLFDVVSSIQRSSRMMQYDVTVNALTISSSLLTYTHAYY